MRKAELESVLGLQVTGKILPPRPVTSSRSGNGVAEAKALKRIHSHLIAEPRTKMRLELDTRIFTDYHSEIYSIEVAGGRSSHYDILVTTVSGLEIKMEVKSSKSKVNPDWNIRPWKIGVQYLNKYIGKDPFGRLLVERFYTDEVLPFATSRYPELGLGLEHVDMYVDEMSKTTPRVVKSDPVSQLLARLKSTDLENRKDLYERWKSFLDNYLRTITGVKDLLDLADTAKRSLEGKDVWLIIPECGCDLNNYHLIGKLSYATITYDTLLLSKNGHAHGFNFTATSTNRGSTPLQIKFLWKNTNGVRGIACQFL